MTSLPECQFRQVASEPGRWRCTCSFLTIPRTFVTGGDCQICPVANGLVSCHAASPSPENAVPRTAWTATSDGRASSIAPLHADGIAPVSRAITGEWPRHLIYHLYPVRASVWRENIEELKRRIAVFTGRRIVSVVFDETTEPRDVVLRELAELEADVRCLDNNRLLGEGVTLQPALEELVTLPGITFYAHAKGVTHRDSSVVFGLWAKRMYTLMDRLDEVSQRLMFCGFCGLIRATGQPVGEGPHQWHYPGSFYWFRNDVVAQRGFSVDHQNRFLAEKFPSYIVRFTESAALYSELLQDNPYVRETWEQFDTASRLPSRRNGQSTGDLLQGRQERLGARPDHIPLSLAGQGNGISPRAVDLGGGKAFPLLRPPAVAIVIAGRNNAPFLAEAIESALSQTVPCEVVYADDYSIDGSLRVAAEYLQRGLLILPSGVHQGVCDARNRGAGATQAENIVFLDADDWLPADYAARCLEAMTPNTPFVYSATRAFGTLINHLWQATPWETYDLWRHNQVHTSALWARWAFEAAGEWQDDVPTMWDYDLAIRCSRFGTPVRSTTSISYRTHADSISVALNERDGTACIPFKEIIRRKNAKLGIGCLVSGRLPGLFPKWMDAVACSVRWAMRYGVLKHKPRLQLFLHGAATQRLQEIQETASRYLDTLESAVVTEFEHRYPQSPESERRNGSATLLAKASAAMQSQSGADVFWVVEDDILVPLRACAWLFQEITAGSCPPHGVSGVYRNRHIADRCIGGWYRAGKYEEPRTFEVDRIQAVDFTGTGCLMYWTGRPETPKQWRSHTADGQAAHDFCWGDDLRMAGGRLLMHGGIRCGHARTELDILNC